MTKEVATTLAVSPSVQWTRGRKHGLIVDYSKKRHQQVPLGVLDVLDAIEEGELTQDRLMKVFSRWTDQVSGYLAFLITNKWVFELSDLYQYQRIEAIASGSSYFKYKNLYVAHSLVDGDLFHRLSKMSREFLFSNFICVLDKKIDHLDDSFIETIKQTKLIGFHHTGVLLNGAQLDAYSLKAMTTACDGMIYNSLRSDKVTGDPIVGMYDLGDEEYIDINRFYVDLVLQLNINGKSTIYAVDAYIADNFILYPHPYEQSYKVAESNDWDKLVSNINSKRMKHYWTLNRSDIDGCSHCEYRRICSNKPWARKSADDLYSRPNNCDQLTQCLSD